LLLQPVQPQSLRRDNMRHELKRPLARGATHADRG
jgi:hypothetical protein